MQQNEKRWRLYLVCPSLEVSEESLRSYFTTYGTVNDVYFPGEKADGRRKGFAFLTFETEECLLRALSAGEEHIIDGCQVKCYRARSRTQNKPAEAFSPSAASQAPPQPNARLGREGLIVPINNLRLSGGSFAAGLATSRSATSSLGQPEAGSSGSSPPQQGHGPRIYVGGVPNTVSETMVRNYFGHWGQVEDVYFPKDKVTRRRRAFCFVTFDSLKAAEKACAESQRQINGYPVTAISLTAERTQHYRQKHREAGQGAPMAGALCLQQPGAHQAAALAGLAPPFASFADRPPPGATQFAAIVPEYASLQGLGALAGELSKMQQYHLQQQVLQAKMPSRLPPPLSHSGEGPSFFQGPGTNLQELGQGPPYGQPLYGEDQYGSAGQFFGVSPEEMIAQQQQQLLANGMLGDPTRGLMLHRQQASAGAQPPSRHSQEQAGWELEMLYRQQQQGLQAEGMYGSVQEQQRRLMLQSGGGPAFPPELQGACGSEWLDQSSARLAPAASSSLGSWNTGFLASAAEAALQHRWVMADHQPPDMPVYAAGHNPQPAHGAYAAPSISGDSRGSSHDRSGQLLRLGGGGSESKPSKHSGGPHRARSGHYSKRSDPYPRESTPQRLPSSYSASLSGSRAVTTQSGSVHQASGMQVDAGAGSGDEEESPPSMEPDMEPDDDAHDTIPERQASPTS